MDTFIFNNIHVWNSYKTCLRIRFKNSSKTDIKTSTLMKKRVIKLTTAMHTTVRIQKGNYIPVYKHVHVFNVYI